MLEGAGVLDWLGAGIVFGPELGMVSELSNYGLTSAIDKHKHMTVAGIGANAVLGAEEGVFGLFGDLALSARPVLSGLVGGTTDTAYSYVNDTATEELNRAVGE